MMPLAILRRNVGALAWCQVAGNAEGRLFEKPMKLCMFVWLGRSQYIARRSGIRGGLPAKK